MRLLNWTLVTSYILYFVACHMSKMCNVHFRKLILETIERYIIPTYYVKTEQRFTTEL